LIRPGDVLVSRAELIGEMCHHFIATPALGDAYSAR
jgi:hypothetical protein